MILVDDNSKHKKAEGLTKIVVAIISYKEYNNVLLNQTCLKHSMNRT